MKLKERKTEGGKLQGRVSELMGSGEGVGKEGRDLGDGRELKREGSWRMGVGRSLRREGELSKRG